MNQDRKTESGKVSKWARGILILTVSLSHLLTFSARAADKINITGTALYQNGAPVVRQPVTLTGTAPLPRTYYTNIYSRQAFSTLTDTNGHFAFSNATGMVIWGFYRLDLPGNPGTSFNLVVGTNFSGTVNVVALITNTATLPPNPATNYYTQAQVDAMNSDSQAAADLRFIRTNKLQDYALPGSGITLVTNVNGSLTFNAQKFADGAQSPLGFLDVGGLSLLTMPQASGSQNGWLAAADFSLFASTTNFVAKTNGSGVNETFSGAASNSPALTITTNGLLVVQTKLGPMIIGTNINIDVTGGSGAGIVLPGNAQFAWHDLLSDQYDFYQWYWTNHGDGTALMLIGSDTDGSIELRPGYAANLAFGATGGYRNSIAYTKRNDDIGWSMPFWFEAENTNGAGGVVYGGVAGYTTGDGYVRTRFYSKRFIRSGAGFSDQGRFLGGTEPNGWNLRGGLVQERTNVTATPVYSLDFSNAVGSVVTLSGSNVFYFATTNTAGGTSNVEMRFFLIRASGQPATLHWPAWDGNAALPTTIPSDGRIELTLRSWGVGETNITVTATTNTDPTFVWDADALTFFTRASITDDIQKATVNNLTLSLKAASLWAKLDAIYPFVGGNATAHSKNLKANTFNITWSGTLTHNANGVTGNGTDGYGDSGWTPSVDAASQNSISGGVYCRTQTPTDSKEFLGVVKSSPLSYFILVPSSVNINARANDTLNTIINTSTDFRGFMGITRTASGASTVQWRSTQFSGSATSVAPASFTVHILSRNDNGAAGHYSNANLAFAFLGDGLTTTELDALRSIVETCELALGRNVP